MSLHYFIRLGCVDILFSLFQSMSKLTFLRWIFLWVYVRLAISRFFLQMDSYKLYYFFQKMLIQRLSFCHCRCMVLYHKYLKLGINCSLELLKRKHPTFENSFKKGPHQDPEYGQRFFTFSFQLSFQVWPSYFI